VVRTPTSQLLRQFHRCSGCGLRDAFDKRKQPQPEDDLLHSSVSSQRQKLSRKNRRLQAIAGTASLIVCLLSAPTTNGQSQSRGSSSTAGCDAPNGGGATSNYYGGGNPCAYRYSITAENLNRLLNEVSYCTMYSRTQVNCSRALRGNYGQIQLDANGNPPAGQSPGTAALGGLRGSPEELWQRAVVLIDRNNYRDAIPLLTQAAKMGHVKAQSTLGIAYQDGNGIRPDDKAAAYWFGLAAAQGHRAAEYALGGMYEEGEGGLPRDKRKATELYLASAKQGFDKAELVVGVGYLVGDGLPNDRRQSIFWLQKANAQGAQLAHDLLIILSDRTAPQQFANMNELLSYLNKLRAAEMARIAARSNLEFHPDNNVVARINAAREFNQWKAERGAGNGGRTDKQ
jgi:hypothetical protein